MYNTQLPGDLEFRSTIYCTYHLGMVTKTYLRSEIHTNFTARWSIQLKNKRDFQWEPWFRIPQTMITILGLERRLFGSYVDHYIYIYIYIYKRISSQLKLIKSTCLLVRIFKDCEKNKSNFPNHSCSRYMKS